MNLLRAVRDIAAVIHTSQERYIGEILKEAPISRGIVIHNALLMCAAIYCRDIYMYQRNIIRAKRDIQQLPFILLFHKTVADC